MLWDRALGYHYIPLPEVPYSNEVTNNENRNTIVERQEEIQKHQTQGHLQVTQSYHATDTSIDNNSNSHHPEIYNTVYH